MSILGVYLFGSLARGDQDNSSDVDVLVVYGENPGKWLKKTIYKSIKAEVGVDVVLAEYSEQRINEMFQQGHLFAWHLFQEASPLKKSILQPEKMLIFERPAPYKTGSKDAKRFINLLMSIRSEVASESVSLVHEAGLTYLALRNIAMSMSERHLPNIDFTRYSPFSLSTALGIDTPCDYVDYLRLISARHSSQRGLNAPAMDGNQLISLLDRSLIWADQVIGNTNEL
jgi:predicted nucleotidyltransferase